MFQFCFNKKLLKWYVSHKCLSFCYEVIIKWNSVEIICFQEPRSLYNEVKIVPLSKLDRAASQQLVRKYLEEEEAKYVPSSYPVPQIMRVFDDN